MSVVKRYFARPAQAFRVKHYPQFWLGNILQFFAYTAEMTAAQWLITDLTNSRTLISLVGFVQGGVVAVSSPFAGVVVDRVPKRNLMVTGRLIFAVWVIVLGTLVLFDVIEVWHLLVFGFIVGITESVMQPATQTYVFDLVGRDKLQQAIGLNSIGSGMAQIVGPGLAGAVIAVAGIVTVFYSAAIGLAIACFVIVLIPHRGDPHPDASASSPIRQLGEGLKYVYSNKPLFWVFIVCGLSFFNGSIYAMRPIFARHVLDVGSAGFGFMAAAQGVGAIAGAVIVSALPATKRPGLLTWASMFAYGCCLFLYSFAFSFEYILIVEFAFGISGQFWMVSVMSGMQMCVPEQMRGRMVSIVFMFAQLGFVGMLITGVLADAVGDQVALGIFGAVPMTILLLIIAFKYKVIAALQPIGMFDDDGAAAATDEEKVAESVH